MIQGLSADLLITEFMANNESVLQDVDGDYSDWIEIYNAGAAAVNLEGWVLTDDPSAPAKWCFPKDTEIEPDSYLVVFASGKDRTETAPLHTNFKLRAGGEYLGLLDSLGGVVSAFSPGYPPQNPDISFGRDASDPSVLLFFSTATPGAENVSGGGGLAPEVDFSRPSGVFGTGESFELALSTTASNATIHYTFGTNEPGPATFEYTAPIEITNSTIVRARATGPGLVAGPVSSRAYVALAPDVQEFSSDLPIMILHNFGQGAVSATKEDHPVAMIGFEPRIPIDRETGPRSSMTDPPVHAERGIFHVRGLLTAVDSNRGKASFLLEIQDESGEDKDLAVFGLPEESDWVLYAVNELDRALIQNPLAHQLRRDFGGYSSRTRFFEMFLKDDRGEPGPIAMEDYYGLFVLEERIKRDGNRVDIDSLQPEHVEPPEITGGYLLSIDAPNDEPQLVAGGAVMNFIDPDGFEMVDPRRAPQLEYIRDYFNAFNAALHGADWRDPLLGYATYIDVDSWIDYHLHSVVTFNADALRLSTYLYKPRNERIQFGPPWDFDISQGSAEVRDFNPRIWRSTVFGGSTDYFNQSPWWFKLFRDPDFWQRWIDRYQELREGPLSTDHVFGLIEGFADEVREAQGREQARWNVLPRTGPVSSDGFTYHFGAEPEYDNEVRFKKDWYSMRLGFIDSQFLDRPELTGHGGWVAPGFPLAVLPPAKPGTSVIATLDGTDPRLPGGGISPTAISILGPLTLTVTTNVRLVARSYNPDHRNRTGPNNPPVSSPWSGPRTAGYYTEIPPLRITDIMYHPQGPPEGVPYNDEDFEFIEVKNIGGASLNIKGFKLSGGIDLVFPDASLEPGELGVVVANTDAFTSRYPWGPRVLGTYSRRLNNAGERLLLEGPLGEPILDFEYNDNWYRVTDGAGFSLVILDATAPPDTWDRKNSWRPSALPGAFPAAEDPPPSHFPKVVINEISSTVTPAMIELRNLSPDAADIGGWLLTDDFANPGKNFIPVGTVLEPGEYMVFDETAFGFSLSPAGEAVYLFSADEGTLTGYVHGFDFGAIEDGSTFGRHVNGTGGEQFPAQGWPTPGEENSGPRIGPIVITEIHYHPPEHVFGAKEFNNTEDEFIELYNSSDEWVPLTANAAAAAGPRGWRLTDAVKFEFGSGQVIPAHGMVLLVGFDPAEGARVQAFRTRHGIPSGVAIYGPFEGRLANSSDRVELRRPLPTVAGPSDEVPYALVERIHYSDESPWPVAADGLGRSLQRIDATAYGNDASNWAAASPTPGRLYSGGTGPTITAHPDNATAVSDTTAVFEVSADGPGPLGYQWRLNGRAIQDATHSILTLTNVQPDAAGDYDAVVVNPAGSATTEEATLTVLMPVRILEQPRNQIVNSGAGAYLHVRASGEPPLHYQWRHNGAPIAGASGPVLNFPEALPPHQGIYDVEVSNLVSSVVSSTATLSVGLKPALLAPDVPLQIAAAPGETVGLGAELQGSFPLWIQWRHDQPGASEILEERYCPSPGPLPLTVTQAVSFLTVKVRNNHEGAYVLAVSNAVSDVPILFTNAVLAVLEDSDLDLMPDRFEMETGLNANDASDAVEDLDGDGMSNRDEYLAGTDLRKRGDVFRLEARSTDDGVILEFGAVSNRIYALEYTDQFPATNWIRLMEVVARSTNHVETFTDNGHGIRYYRLRTPAATEPR